MATTKIRRRQVGAAAVGISNMYLATLSGLHGFSMDGEAVRVNVGDGNAISTTGQVYSTAIGVIQSPLLSMSISTNPRTDLTSSTTMDFLGFPQWSSDTTPGSIGGQTWLNTTDSSIKTTLIGLTKYVIGGMMNSFSTNSTAIANTTTETSFSNISATIKNGDATSGRVIRLTAWGTYSTTGTPTIQFRMKLSGANVVQGGNLTTITNASSRIWRVDATLVIRTGGNPGSTDASMRSSVDNDTVSVNTRQGSQAPNLAVDAAVTLSAAWSAASSSNTITCTGGMIELVG